MRSHLPGASREPVSFPARPQGLRSALWLVIFAWSVAGVAWAAEPAGFVDRFDSFGAPNSVWAMQQLQRGKIEPSTDPLDPSNRALAMRAGGRSGSVGKAALVHRFMPAGPGRTAIMRGRFFVPHGAPLDSVILMDLECARCGLDTNPGIRLYLRDGRLRVDRSKIGIKQAITPRADQRMSAGRWHHIEWRVALGHGKAGRTVVMVDGKTVIDARGDTLLSKAVVRKRAPIDVLETVDRFQIGLTANSNRRAATLLVDDVSFMIQ